MKVQTVYLVDSLKDVNERGVFEFLFLKRRSHRSAMNCET